MTHTICITGANRGIGLALARHAADRGMRVIGTARDPGRATDLAGVKGDAGPVHVETLDIANDDSVRAMADRLAGDPIDILVNNAGIFPKESSDLTAFEPEAFTRVLHTNVVGPCMVTRALRPNVEKSQRKLIVNISSTMGSIARAADGSTGHLGYHSSKAALNMINTLLANELGPAGIACVAIHPGWVQTDMGGSSAHLTPDESASAMLDTIAALDAGSNGSFVSYDGSPLPW